MIGLVLACVCCRRAGYPFGTLVDFASDGAGLPIFCLSPLAIHARNLIEDPRCSLVVQMPGWTGLANARVTIFGDVYQLPPDMQVRGGAALHSPAEQPYCEPADSGSCKCWLGHNTCMCACMCACARTCVWLQAWQVRTRTGSQAGQPAVSTGMHAACTWPTRR